MSAPRSESPAAGWSPDELSAIGGAEEIDIAPRRRDGSLGKRVTIWVVPHAGGLYVRSWRGPTAAWFRGVQATHEGRIWAGRRELDVRLRDAAGEVDPAVDEGFRSKYRRHGADYVEDMVAPPARETTMEVVPRR